MKSKLIWGLLGANVALAAMFVHSRMSPAQAGTDFASILSRATSSTAMGQRIERPSDYLLIPGEVSGVDRGVVFIVDTSNGMMSAVAFEESSGRIEVMPPMDLVRVFEEGAAGEAGNGRRRTR